MEKTLQVCLLGNTETLPCSLTFLLQSYNLLSFVSIATVNILANDDGNGIISFNNSEHFLLREPTSVSGHGESGATLCIIRDPPKGTFGTVTVQFTITDANGSLYTDDLTPSYGFVVLEDGVRFKV